MNNGIQNGKKKSKQWMSSTTEKIKVKSSVWHTPSAGTSRAGGAPPFDH